jgi:hypothetical protein
MNGKWLSNRMMRTILLLLPVVFIHSCTDPEGQGSTVAPKTIRSGEELASVYCGSCHLPVSPGMIDSTSWVNHVLPEMAKKMGIGVWQENQYYIKNKNDTGGIDISDWDKIVEYYSAEAPAVLKPVAHNRTVKTNRGLFTVSRPVGKFNNSVSTTTMVFIDSINSLVYTSDASGNLHKWSRDLELSSEFKLPSPGVHMNILEATAGKRAMITCVGNIMATDDAFGKVVSVNIDDPAEKLTIIADRLQRPVQFSGFDFNRDGSKEFLLAEFGHNTGKLSIMGQQKDSLLLRTSLWDKPGASQVEMVDYNDDGWMDFVVLFAQGDEGIWLFQNNKKGFFDSKNLLRFSPANGSTSFQLADFNSDGKLDILYTCGDNSDYSRVLKPYHGVYIYLNSGAGNYSQHYFYPINGCTKAIAKDFDADGDLDIAAIAFFADLKDNPSEKFVLLEQSSGFQFNPNHLPIEKEGRWICMDVSDFDGDGDSDIILGNYSQGFINQDSISGTWNTSIPFIVLKNNIQRVTRH